MLAPRDRVLLLLAREPGLHLRAMPRRLGVSLRTVRYHLDHLARENRALPHRAGRFVRWFRPGDFSLDERALISAVRVRGQRLILEQIAAAGSMRWVDLLAATKLPKASLSWHLRALAQAHITSTDSQGRHRLLDACGVAMGLALHRQRLAESLADSAEEIFERPG